MESFNQRKFHTSLVKSELVKDLFQQKMWSPNFDIVYQFASSQLSGEENNKSKWKMEYEDKIYKIYDWDKNLAAYFFPK